MCEHDLFWSREVCLLSLSLSRFGKQKTKKCLLWLQFQPSFWSFPGGDNFLEPRGNMCTHVKNLAVKIEVALPLNSIISVRLGKCLSTCLKILTLQREGKKQSSVNLPFFICGATTEQEINAQKFHKSGRCPVQPANCWAALPRKGLNVLHECTVILQKLWRKWPFSPLSFSQLERMWTSILLSHV